MFTDRRSFLAGVGALAAASAGAASTRSRPSGKAIAFDGFPIIDARPLGAKAEPDQVWAFKPATRAYEMGVEAFGLKKDQIIFCAAAGWDAAGARAFGYRTFWLNRTKQPAEELGVKADGEGARMDDLVRFALGG